MNQSNKELKKKKAVERCWLRTRFSMLKLANKCAIYGKENVTALNAQVARDFANEEYLGGSGIAKSHWTLQETLATFPDCKEGRYIFYVKLP
jgi:hypothetical protein